MDGGEVHECGSSPLLVDTDGDGLVDYDECEYTDATVADTDGDGLSDGDEVHTHATDPLVVDTDGGGVDDGTEVNTDGTDPLDPYDDLVADSNNCFVDSDGDGIGGDTVVPVVDPTCEGAGVALTTGDCDDTDDQLGDTATDTDCDGALNDADLCEGFDDTADGDSDGVPDGCDDCLGFDDTADGDGDGAPVTTTGSTLTSTASRTAATSAPMATTGSTPTSTGFRTEATEVYEDYLCQLVVILDLIEGCVCHLGFRQVGRKDVPSVVHGQMALSPAGFPAARSMLRSRLLSSAEDLQPCRIQDPPSPSRS